MSAAFARLRWTVRLAALAAVDGRRARARDRAGGRRALAARRQEPDGDVRQHGAADRTGDVVVAERPIAPRRGARRRRRDLPATREAWAADHPPGARASGCAAATPRFVTKGDANNAPERWSVPADGRHRARGLPRAEGRLRDGAHSLVVLGLRPPGRIRAGSDGPGADEDLAAGGRAGG